MNTNIMEKQLFTTSAPAVDTVPAGLSERQIYNRLQKIQDLENTIKMLTAERDAIRADIMRDAESMLIDCKLFKLDAGRESTTSFDGKAFKADHPEMYAEYLKPGSRSKFRYKFK